MVEEVAEPLVDGAEDRRLQEAELIFYDQEPDGTSALGGGTLEDLEEPGGTCPRTVGEILYLLARGDAELS